MDGEKKKRGVKQSAIMAVVLLLLIIEHGRVAGYYGEVRIDTEPNYYCYQDIVKAFNMSPVYWFYGLSYKARGYETEACSFLSIEELTSERMNFSASFQLNGKGYAVGFVGYFRKTNDTDHATSEREKDNEIEVHQPGGTEPPRIYRQIYSDFETCVLLRVTDKDGGMGCSVLVTDSAKSKPLARSCQSMYKNACRKDSTMKVIPNNDCQGKKAGLKEFE